MKRALVVCALAAVAVVPVANALDRTEGDRRAGKQCKAQHDSDRVESAASRSMPNRNKGKCRPGKANTEMRRYEAVCKRLRSADVAQFARTHQNLRRCVKVKKAEARATAACKEQRSDDALTFAETYKSLGRCVQVKIAKLRAASGCKKRRTNDGAGSDRALQKRDRCVKKGATR